MAKDVDLSSKEWTDLIFEGKNKEFGAYKLRQGSIGRHNRAMIVIVFFIALLFVLAFVVNTVIKSAEARPEDMNEQELMAMSTDEVQEEEPQEDETPFQEPEVQEVLQEELLNTTKLTELNIVADNEVTEEIKSVEEQMADERAVGAVNEDRGVDDIINAQEHKEVVVVEEKKPEPVVEHKVFEAVEQMPTFPGGDKALYDFISSKLVFPQEAIEDNVGGRVSVRFVVKKDGSIGEAKIARGKHPALDKEALRVVKLLPKFIPGKQNGQAVDVWFTLPINFNLQSAK
ncbi:MAG: energy transducer TonB [Paramuribaculum sp.]|nr:energy transducer TonB [Paramuribaculum sp.]